MMIPLKRPTKGQAIAISLGGLVLGVLGAVYVVQRGRRSMEPKEIRKEIDQVLSKSSAIVNFSAKKIVSLPSSGINFKGIFLANLNSKFSFQSFQAKNPFVPPFERGIFVGDVTKTHRVFFNKFALIPRHMLVVTKKQEDQMTPCTKEDFEAGFLVQRAFKEAILFINGGKIAGSSINHKHLQVLPVERDNQCINTEVIDALEEKAKQYSVGETFTFGPYQKLKHVMIRVESPFDYDRRAFLNQGQHLKESYDQLMDVLGNYKAPKEKKEISQAYNLLIGRNFMMLVIRAKEKAYNNQISLNSIAFLGTSSPFFFLTPLHSFSFHFPSDFFGFLSFSLHFSIHFPLHFIGWIFGGFRFDWSPKRRLLQGFHNAEPPFVFGGNQRAFSGFGSKSLELNWFWNLQNGISFRLEAHFIFSSNLSGDFPV